ncbi:DUF2264 domain-containing protein [Streptomyces caniscabiei]|uniref:DUF2264 domain-containing protein n=1 Tax=Streptomyces caniscabiei TaxID=2746961 RepID=UPI0029B639B1|nr:DUF2264 domain-containing protein [Streptomyces caniscabiei]MDX2605279.1 DUF2264 domain-containing protein [Streptomyces caniscabiei]MDX2738437.1 DUF2264 domain-containing protein [Streptomyces caniscabiei]MDX2780491.1 DUF2264 domain-containing protein [Streptomyces caniscabiei]
MTAPHMSPADSSTLPPTDSLLSPLTGWTRAHWEALADRLLDGIEPYASPGLAQYRLPGRASHSGALSDGLEGFARSFLLAAFRIAGARGRVGPALIERYAAGLAAGTDPAGGDERWPAITDRAQPMVEAASIAIALHETRPWLWDRLDDGVRARVADWLGGFVGADVNDSNWRLFQVITEEFLASVGAPHSRAEIDAGLARLEDWYRGGGWYTDGDGRKFDYYNGWALHLYPVLWARIAGLRADPAAVARHRARLREFLAAHQHFFGADGGPLHQGRSLTYRFATTAPLWAGALADATPLPPGRTRRLASGALRHFAERGVPDERGLLTLGWYRPFLPVTQRYSGPASPYWASKAFLGLLLPESHPVWTAPEEPAPIDTDDTTLVLPGPGWLLHTTAADGLVRLVNHGSDRLPPPPATADDSPHYARLAYSSATAPETPAGPDNHLALLAPDGTPSPRGRIRPLGAEGRRAASRYGGPDGDGIETVSVVHGPWEVRVHRVHAPVGTPVREGGWAVADDDGPPEGTCGPGWALARRADGLTSALVGLHGWGDGPGTVVPAAGTNAYGHHSATPVLEGRTAPGGQSLLVTLVLLSGDPHTPHTGASATVDAGGDVDIRFPDGTRESVRKGEMPYGRPR